MSTNSNISLNANNTSYYRIDRKNFVSYFDMSTLAQMKSILFCELGEKDHTTIGNNINILFNTILKNNNQKDQYGIISILSEEFQNLSLFNFTEKSLSLNLCQKIATKNYQMQFTFNENNIEEISILLTLGILKLNLKRDPLSFMTFSQFLSKIEKYKNTRIDFEQIFNYYSKENEIDNIKIPNYQLPYEILLLMKKFQAIKKINFEIKNYSNDLVIGSLLILFNLEWLLPYVFEVDFNLNFNNDLKDIQKYKNLFDIIIIFSYFVEKFKFLNDLSLVIPYSYIKEIKKYFILKKITLLDFHFIEFFYGINNLNSLKIEFNSLDSNTFEAMFSLIQNNTNLKKLHINLFPNNKNYYSVNNLMQLAEQQGFNKKNKNLNDGKNIALNKLIENFENNIENLFILLQTKKNLDEICLIINEANEILVQDGFYWIIVKFIFNIIIMLSKNQYNYKKFKIEAPFLNLNNNLIDDFLKGVNLNSKNILLDNFYFNAKLSKLNNIQNILSTYYKCLYLGNIDNITFQNFINFYKSKTFIEKSELYILNLELNESCKNELIEFMKTECPKKLYEINFILNFDISGNEFKDLISYSNGNCIKKYTFKFNKKNNNDYDNIIKNSKVFYIDVDYKNMANKYLSIVKKYSFHSKDKINIFKKLFKYLLPKNLKKIDIVNNNK